MTSYVIAFGTNRFFCVHDKRMRQRSEKTKRGFRTLPLTTEEQQITLRSAGITNGGCGTVSPTEFRKFGAKCVSGAEYEFNGTRERILAVQEQTAICINEKGLQIRAPRRHQRTGGGRRTERGKKAFHEKRSLVAIAKDFIDFFQNCQSSTHIAGPVRTGKDENTGTGFRVNSTFGNPLERLW
jgi:hypothetical protein